MISKYKLVESSRHIQVYFNQACQTQPRTFIHLAFEFSSEWTANEIVNCRLWRSTYITIIIIFHWILLSGRCLTTVNILWYINKQMCHNTMHLIILNKVVQRSAVDLQIALKILQSISKYCILLLAWFHVQFRQNQIHLTVF